MSERLGGGEPFRQPQYGDRFQNPSEDPRIGLRQLARQELTRIRWSASDALAVEIALKGLAKLDLKDMVDRMQMYRDDVTVRQQMKHLGSLVLVEAVSHLSYENEPVGLKIKRDDPYIDFHVPPLSDKEKELPSISESLRWLQNILIGMIFRVNILLV